MNHLGESFSAYLFVTNVTNNFKDCLYKIRFKTCLYG